MKRNLIVCLILVFSLSINFALVSQDDVILQVSENGVVSVTHEIVAENETSIELKIPTTIKGTLEVFDSLRDITLNYSYNEFTGELTFKVPERYLATKEVTAFRVKYDTLMYTSKVLGTWTLSFDIDVSPNKTTVQIIFPQNTKLLSTNSKVRTFVKENLLVLEIIPSTERFVFSANYEITPVGKNQTKSQDVFKILTLFVLAIFVVMIVIYLWSTQKKSKIKKRVKKAPPKIKKARKIKDSVVKVLDENEKKVVNFLESRVDASHAQIHRGTKMPKTTLSKVIKRLEMRNIVEKRPYGKRSRVSLQKWVFE